MDILPYFCIAPTGPLLVYCPARISMSRSGTPQERRRRR